MCWCPGPELPALVDNAGAGFGPLAEALNSGNGPTRASLKPGGPSPSYYQPGNLTVHHVPQNRGRSHIAALRFSYSASVPCRPNFAVGTL